MHADLPRLQTSVLPNDAKSNDARYRADNIRMVTEVSLLPPSEQTKAEQFVAQSQPIMEVDENDSDDQDLSVTEEQKSAVQWVPRRSEEDHHGLLGIEEGSSDAPYPQRFCRNRKKYPPIFQSR